MAFCIKDTRMKRFVELRSGREEAWKTSGLEYKFLNLHCSECPPILAMVLLSLALLASALTGVLAQTGCRYGPSTSNQSGINNGFYYTWATEIDNDSSGCPYGSGNITLSTGGRYTVEWNGMGLTYGGKGWSKGSNDRYIFPTFSPPPKLQK